MGSTGLFFHFLVVLFISGNFRLHTSLHPHCICTAEAWYPPCLLSTKYTHKVQGKNLSDSTHRPLNAGPQDIAPGKGYCLPERGSAGHTGEARQVNEDSSRKGPGTHGAKRRLAPCPLPQGRRSSAAPGREGQTARRPQPRDHALRSPCLRRFPIFRKLLPSQSRFSRCCLISSRISGWIFSLSSLGWMSMGVRGGHWDRGCFGREVALALPSGHLHDWRGLEVILTHPL